MKVNTNLCSLSVVAACLAAQVQAAGPYYLKASGTNIDGPFTTASYWEDAEGNFDAGFDSDADYVVRNSLILRSFNSTWNNCMFGGKSLSVGDGSSGGTMFHYAAANATGNYTDTGGISFNQLILANGTVTTQSGADRVFNIFGPVTVSGENNYVRAGYSGADIRFRGKVSDNGSEHDRIRFAGNNAMVARFMDATSVFRGILRVETAGSTLDLSGTQMSVYADMLKGTAIRVDRPTQIRRVNFQAADSDVPCVLKIGGVGRVPGSLTVSTTFQSASFNNTSPYSCSLSIGLVLESSFKMPVGADRVEVLKVPAQTSTKAINTDMLTQCFALDASAMRYSEDYSLAMDADTNWKRIYVCRKKRGCCLLFR